MSLALTHGLHRAARTSPDAPATVCGQRVRGWSESRERVARLAGVLRGLGVGRGDRVAILGGNSDVYHELLLAVAWADAVFVPVNTRWSDEEIAFSLRDCGARLLVVEAGFADHLQVLRRLAPDMDTVVYSGRVDDGPPALEELFASAAPCADAGRGGAELAGIFYTGGTTGRAKGVMLSHENLLASALGSMASGLYVRPGTRYLHAAPMFHAADISGWVCVNVLGGTHLFVSRFDPAEVAATIQRYRVTDSVLVPTLLGMLVDAPSVRDADLSSLRRVIYGGSPIAPAVLDRVTARLPGTELVQVYGMTEMSPVMTLLCPCEHHDPVLRTSAGQPAPHVELRVVDEHDRDVPAGTVGQILARGPGRMLGYWNRPEETSAALAGGWMHTGDSGRLDEHHNLFVVDRLKDMIISGGENVYSTEVENVLLDHPAVALCAVIGVPDPRWGERVHAVVVLAPEASATEDELREHVRAHIANYKTPRTVEFATSLPLSGPGKVLKRELRAPYTTPVAT
jgi:acyl-CoA synthetase (AMP-forming)/AMP-acid ligase II